MTSSWFKYCATAIGGMYLGATFIGYPLGVRNEARNCTLVWNLNDVFGMEKLKASALTKEECLNHIRLQGLARHRSMITRLESSPVDKLLFSLSKQSRKSVARLNDAMESTPGEGQE